MLTPKSEQKIYTLENFEGPLLFLLHLAQKSEINICSVPLQRIVSQYYEEKPSEETEELDEGAEFIGATASLLWLKSQTLLPIPQREVSLLPLGEEESPFAILPQLIEYLKFKQQAKEMGELEFQQQNFFVRGQPLQPEEIPCSPQLQPISLQKFVEVFQEVLRRSQSRRGTIHEEKWRVGDKILFIRQCLSQAQAVSFKQLFSEECCREELIVTFLGVLELMKIGELRICQDTNGGLYLQRGETHGE